MISALILYLILYFLPPAIVMYARSQCRLTLNSCFYALVLLNVLGVSLLAPLSYWMGFGLAKYLLVLGLASLLNYYLAYFLLQGLKPMAYPAGRILIFCLLLTLGTLCIYGASGWTFQHMNWFHGGEAYFRPPFTHDIERNVIITNALIRKSETPYLPYGHFAYQLLWYHIAAVIVSLYSDVAHYPQVAGVIVGTSALFFFCLLSMVAHLRTDVIKSKWFFAVLPVLFFHVDILNGIKAVARFGTWSVDEITPVFFRYVSLQSMSVVSPQHCLFSVLFIGFLLGAGTRLFRDGKQGNLWQGWFFVFCFLCSPMLSVLVFPFYALHEYVNASSRNIVLRRWLFLSVVAFLGHWLLLRYSPSSLFFRPTGEKMLFTPGTASYLWALPLAPIFSGGLLGGLAMLVVVSEWRRQKRFVLGAEPFFLLSGMVLLQFVVSHSEIRRYFSMIASVISFVLVVERLPKFDKAPLLRKWAIGLGSFALLACFSQSYFYKFYLFDPSTLNERIPWKDYFAMNQWIETKRLTDPRAPSPPQRILAASSIAFGLEKPLVMEVATSFSSPPETAIHTHLSTQQFELIKLIHRNGSAVPFASFLGYDKMLWGPVEELIWGKAIRDQFINIDTPLFRTGSVGLYDLKKETRSASSKN